MTNQGKNSTLFFFFSPALIVKCGGEEIQHVNIAQLNIYVYIYTYIHWTVSVKYIYIYIINGC